MLSFWNPRTARFNPAEGDTGALSVAPINSAFTDTSTPLAIDGVFMGVTRGNISTQQNSRFVVASTADVAGTLSVEQSANGTVWVLTHTVATAPNTDAGGIARHTALINAPVCAHFVRVRYRNGATGQATFQVLSMLARI